MRYIIEKNINIIKKTIATTDAAMFLVWQRAKPDATRHISCIATVLPRVESERSPLFSVCFFVIFFVPRDTKKTTGCVVQSVVVS